MSFPPGGRQSVGGLSTVGCSVSDGALWLTWVGRVRRVGAGVLWVVCGGWECQMFLSWWVYELVRWRAGAGGGGVRHPMAFVVKWRVRKSFPVMILRACCAPAR